MIEVIRPGAHTLVQDRGRPGHYALGLPPSGALDMLSHDVANLLVGNSSDAATLEITLIGPKLEFRADATVALTGADLVATLDDEPLERWTTVVVRRGQTLACASMKAGARGYLSVRGGVDVPTVLGSRSTYVPGGLGGIAGRALIRGDRLDVGSSTAGPAPRTGTRVADGDRAACSRRVEVRVVPGLCDYRLTDASVRLLYDASFTVSHEANRTGYRFRGPQLEFEPREPPFGAGSNASNVVDLGYPIGSIQAPNGEELICLHRDAVTGGGYATIGTVITADLDVVAQCRPGDEAQFVPVLPATALEARRDRARRLARIAETIRPS